MNYSRAGTPTPVNKPGVDKRIDDKMDILLEQQRVIEEALEFYSNKMRANDFWYDWYDNAHQSFERKYEKLMREIANTSGVSYESTKGEEAKAESLTVGSNETARKEEKPVGKKS